MMRAAILLRSGRYLDLAAPDPETIDPVDVAHGLGHLCRFTGHVGRFYSVAEHSWHASYLVPSHLALAALLHDAQEAFIGDVSQPLKTLLPDYREIERRMAHAIAERFGLGSCCDDPLVKAADLSMLATEKYHLMPVTDQDWPILTALPDRLAEAGA